jgi:DNA-directed RNA polymerase subunit K/omega
MVEPYLTRYEEVCIISTRAMQLNQGDPPKIKLEKYKYYTANDIAQLEYEQNKLNFLIERQLYDNCVEVVEVSKARHPK